MKQVFATARWAHRENPNSAVFIKIPACVLYVLPKADSIVMGLLGKGRSSTWL